MALGEENKRRFFVGGNWKANGNANFIKEFSKSCLNKTQFNSTNGDVVITPPILYAPMLQDQLKESMMQVGAQNVSKYGQGAYTGQTSVEQLRDNNINWVIVGHSERRIIMSENDFDVGAQAK